MSLVMNLNLLLLYMLSYLTHISANRSEVSDFE